MENNCPCKKFEKYSKPSDNIFENFKIVATTKERKKESTTLLQCPECNSYYLLDIYNPAYTSEEKISIIKYFPKINEEGLVKILNNLEGRINRIQLDEYSKLRKTISQILEKTREPERNPNENIN